MICPRYGGDMSTGVCSESGFPITIMKMVNYVWKGIIRGSLSLNVKAKKTIGYLIVKRTSHL